MLLYNKRAPLHSNIPSRARLKLEAAIDSSTWIPKVRFLDTARAGAQVILFSPPNPHEMQFLSLAPITLDLAASDQQTGRQRADSLLIDERDEVETNRMENLVKKMALHFPKHEGQPTQGAEVLNTCIDQVTLLSAKANQRLTAPGNCRTFFSGTINNDIRNLENVLLVCRTESVNRPPISVIMS